MSNPMRDYFTRRSPTAGRAIVAAWLASYLVASVPVSALPQDGQVTGGEGTITQTSETTLRIEQASQRMAADFSSFDIAANEAVNVLQPGRTAVFLGNITGQSATTIFGTLTSNGQVILVNPRGVVFGENSRVETGALIASTLGVDHDAFMAGALELEFSAETAGRIINRGVIEAASGGSVALLGDEVVNEGLIVAELGRVDLASGSRATVTFDNDGLIGLEVTESAFGTLGGESAVLNAGTVEAAGGQIFLTADAAQDLFDRAVNNEGMLRANTAQEINGEIVLSSTGDTYSSGGISATNDDGVGGAVRVLGDRVAVTSGRIDVSGSAGGGEILVGGDFQGRGDVQTASDTVVGSGAELLADATDEGDGGRIIVWADDATRFFGSLRARGGDAGGDGGFAEVSGKQNLRFAGSADLSAANGASGELLLDPDNITIADGGADDLTGDVNDDTDPNRLAFDEQESGNVDSTIDADTITTILDGGTTVTLQAQDDITVNEAVDASGATTAGGGLTLQAGDDIQINQNVRLSNGDLMLVAGDDGATPVAPDGTADIIIASGLTLDGFDNVTMTADGVVSLSSDITAATNLTLTSDADAAGGESISIDAAAVTLNVGGQTDLVGDLLLTTRTLTLNGGGAINAETVSGAAGGVFDVNSGTDLTVTGAVTGGTVDLAGLGTATFQDAVTIDDLTTSTDGFDLTFTGTGNTFANAVTISNTGTTTLGDDSADTFVFTGGLTAANGLDVFADVTAGGATDLAIGDLNVIGNSSLTTGAGAISADAVSLDSFVLTTDSGGNTTLVSVAGNAGSALDVDGAADFDVSGTTAPETVNLAGITGTASFADAVTVTNFVTAAEAFDLTLAGSGNTFTTTVAIDNTGTTTLGDAAIDTFVFNGGLTAANALTLFADVSAAGAADLTLGDLTLDGDTSLSTGTGALSAGAVTLGGSTLTTNTGGSTDFTSVAGGAGSLLDVNGATSFTVATTTNVEGVELAGIVGATFSGAVTVDDFTTATQAFDVDFTGTGNSFTNAVTFNNTGSTQFGDDSADSFAFSGNLVASNAVELFGDIDAAGAADIDFGATTLLGDSSVNVDSGTLTFNDTIDGTSSFGESLTVGSTAGNVDFDGVIGGGGSSELGTLTVERAATVNLNASLRAASLVADNGGAGATIDIFDADAAPIDVSGPDDTNGGDARIAASTMVRVDTVSAAGGTSNAGNGFDGGDIALDAGALLVFGNLDAFGSAAAAGDGGAGGQISLRNQGAAGVATATNTLNVAGGAAAGGNDGARGTLVLRADTGAITQGAAFDAAELLAIADGAVTLTQANAVDALAVSITGAGDLTFNNAASAVNLGASVAGTDGITTNGGDVVVTTGAGGAQTVVGAIATSGGLVDLNADTGGESIAVNATVDTAGGSFTAQAFDFTSTATITTGGGNVDLDGTFNDVNIDADVVTGGGSFSAGAGNAATFDSAGVTIDTSGAADTAGGDVTLDIVSGVTLGDIDASGGAVGAGAGVAGGSVSVTNTADTSVALIDTRGSAAAAASGAAGGSGGSIFLDADAGSSTLTLNGDLLSGGGAGDGAGAVGAGGAVTLDGMVVLADSVNIDTGAGAGAIAFNVELDGTGAGAEDLGLNAGTGDIDFNAGVGQNVALGGLTITAANNVTSQDDITVASFTQTAGTGTTDLSATAQITTTGAVDITNADVQIGSSLDAGTTLSLTADTGTLETFTSTITAGDAATFSGATSLVLGDTSITTTDDNVSFLDAVDYDTSLTIDTGAGAGDIVFQSTLDGDGAAVDFTAGTGSVDFQDAVGATGALGDFTLNSAANVDVQSTFDGTSFTQTAGSGTTTIGGALTTDGGDIIINNGAIAIDALLDTFTGTLGTVTLNATSGALTLAAAGDITSQNTVSLTGATGISTAGDVAVNEDGDALSFNSATTLTGNVGLSTNNGDLTFTSTLTGTTANTETLDVAIGDGILSFDGAVGATALGDVTIAFAGDVTTSSTFDAASFTQTDGSGTTTIGDTLTATTGDVSITTDTIDLNAAIDASAAGAVTLDSQGSDLVIAAAGDITADGIVSLLGATAISTAGDVTTNDANITFGNPVTLDGAVALDTGSGAGDVQFAGTVDGAQALSIAAGTGNVDLLGGDVGGTTPLASLDISSADTVDVLGITTTGALAVTATTLNINGSDTNLSSTGGGDITLDTAANAAGSGALTIAASGGNGNVSLTGGLTAAGDDDDLDLTAAGTGAVSVGAALTGLASLDVTANQIDITDVDATSNIVLTAGNIDLNGTDATLVSTAGNLSLNGAVDLDGSGTTTLDVSTGGNALLITGTVTDAGNDDDFTLAAGAGTIDLQSALSGMQSLAVSSASLIDLVDVTTVGGGIDITSTSIEVNGTDTSLTAGADNLVLTGAVALDGSGTLTFTGPDSVVVDGALTGAGDNDDVVILSTGGPVDLLGAVSAISTLDAESGATLSASAVTTAGNLSLEGAAISINGTNTTLATTEGGTLTLDGAVSLDGDGTTTFDTDGTSDGDLLVMGLITGVGADDDLTIDAGAAGNVEIDGFTGIGAFTLDTALTFTSEVNAASATTIDVVAADTGRVDFLGGINATTLNVNANGGTYDVTLANTGTINDAFTPANAGQLTIDGISFTNGVNLGGVTTILDGNTVTVAAGSTFGAIEVTDDTVLDIGANTVSIGTIDEGTGATASGLTITNNGTLNLNSPIGGTTPLENFSVTGSGTTNFNGGTIDISGNTTVFGTALVLGADTTITDAGTGLAIDFQNTVNSDAGQNRQLTLNANNATPGTIQFGGVVGGDDPLSNLIIGQSGGVTLAANVTLDNQFQVLDTTGTIQFDGTLAATSIDAQDGAGSYAVTFNAGPVISGASTFADDGASGVALNLAGGGTFDFQGGLSVTTGGTTLAGDVTTTNSAVDLAGALELTGDGSFATGTGTVDLAAIDDDGNAGTDSNLAITTSTQIDLNGAIGSSRTIDSLTVSGATATRIAGGSIAASGGTLTFNTPVTLLDDTTLVDAGGTGIAFNSTVDSDATARALSVEANGGGTIAFADQVGNGSALSALTVVDSSGTTFSDTVDVNGAVTLTETNGTIQFQNVLTAGSVAAADSATMVVDFVAAPDVSGTGSFANDGGVSFGAGGTFDGGFSTDAGTQTSLDGTLNTEAGNGNLTLGDTLVLTADAALESGSGTISTQAITGAFDLAVQNLTSTGAVTVNGAITVDSLTTFGAGYALSLLEGGTITQDVNFLNTGALTLGDAAGDTLTFDAGLATTGNATNPGAVSLAGTIQTTNDAIDIGSATLTADTVIDQGATGSALRLATITAGGGNDLVLDGGTAGVIDITGALVNIGALEVRDSAGTTFGGTVQAGAVTLTDTTGTIEFQNVLSAASVAAAAQGFAVDFDAAPDVAGAGTFDNTGGVTFAAGGAFDGGLTSTASTTTLTGALTAANNAIALGATTLANNASIDAGDAAVTAGVVTGGGNDLVLDAGPTGTLAVTSFDGGGDLTIVDSANATFSGAVTAGTVTLSDTTGTIAFQDDTTINTQLATASQGYAVSFTGATNSVAGDTNFANTGQITLGNDATDAITFAGGVDTTSASGTRSAGTVAVTTGDMTLGDLTLDAASTLTSGANAIDVASVSGAGLALTLQDNTAGSTGAVTITGSTTLGSLVTFGQAYDVSLLGGGTITADTTFLNTTTVSLGDDAADSISFDGGLDTTAATSTRIGGTVATVDQQIDLGAVTLDANATLDANDGAINAASITDGVNNFALSLQRAGATGAVTVAGDLSVNTLATFAGAYDLNLDGGGMVSQAVDLLNTGAVRIGDDAADIFDFDGGLDTTNGPSALSLAGTIRTDSRALDLRAATLTDDTVLASGAGAITSAGVNGAFALTLQEDNAGSTGTVSFNGDVVVADIVTFGRPYAVELLGTTTTVTNAVDFLNTTTVTLGNGGDTLTFSGGLATAGNANNPATTIVSGDVATAGANDLVLGAVTVGSASTLDSAGGALTTGAITGAGTDLTLDADTGAVTVDSFSGLGAVVFLDSGTADVTGDSSAASVDLNQTNNGAITFDGVLTATTLTTDTGGGDADFDLALNAGTAITNDVNFDNTGTLSIGGVGTTSDFDGGLDTTAVGGTVSLAGLVRTAGTAMNFDAVTLAQATDIDSRDGAIDFAGAITSGGRALSLDGGASGAITATSLAGGGDLTIVDSDATTFSGAVTVGTMTLTDTSSTIAFQDDVNVNTALVTSANPYALSFTGTTSLILGNTSLLNTGAVTFGDGGTDAVIFNGGLSSAAPSVINLNGDVTAGAATISLGDADTGISVSGTSRVVSAGGVINVADVTLNDGASLSLGAAASANTVNLSSAVGTVGGAVETLVIDTSGAVTVAGAIGATGNALGQLTVTQSGGVDFQGSVDAATVTLTDTTGTIAFGGDTTIGTALGTAAQGYSVAFTGANNSVAGATTFLNTGTVSLGDAIGDVMEFTGGIDTTGGPSGTSVAGTLRTGGAGGQDVDLNATTLTANATINANDGAVTIASVTDGGNGFALSLQEAGATGAVSIGGFTLGALTTAVGAYDVSLLDSGTVTGDTNFANTGTVTLGDAGAGTDSLDFLGGLDTTSASTTNLAATVRTDGTQMDLGASALTAATTLRSGAGAINVASVAGSGQTLALQTGGDTGDVTITGAATIGTLTTGGSAYDVFFNAGAGGTATVLESATTFANSGLVSFGDDAADTTTVGGDLDTSTNTSATELAGLLTTQAANGAQTLSAATLNAASTVSSGAGAISLASVAGAGQSLTLQDNTAASTGAVTVAGDLTVNALTTFAQGYAVSLNGGGTVTSATTFLNTGNLALGDDAGDALTFAGGLNTNAVGGTVSTAGSITTGGTALDLADITLAAATSLDSAGGALDVATVTSAGNPLSLDGDATGTVTMTSFAGGGDLTVVDSASTTVSGTVDAGTVTLTDTTGTIAFQDDVTIGTGLITSGNAYSVSFTGTTNSIAGATNFLNSATVTLGDGGDATTFDAGVVATAPAIVNLNGDVLVNTGVITLGDGDTTLNVASTTTIGGASTGAISLGLANLADDVALTVGTGIANEINIAGVVGTADGGATTESLIIDTTGVVTVSSAIGAVGGGNDLDVLTITQSGGTTFEGTVDAVAVTLTDTTGDVVFEDATSITGSLATAAQNYGVRFIGPTTSVAGATTFVNTGTLTFGDDLADVVTFTGGVDTTGVGTTFVEGRLATGLGAGQDIDLGATTLNGPSTLNAGAGVLNVASVTDGGNGFGLTVQNAAATGAVSIGAFTLGSLTTQGGAYDVSLLDNGTVTGDTNFLNTGTVTLGDAGAATDVLQFLGGLATAGNASNPASTVIAADIVTNDTRMDLGAVTINAASRLRSGDGAIVLDSVAASGQSLTLQAGGANGTVTINGASTIGTLVTAAGPYDLRFNASAGGTTTTLETATTFLNTGTVSFGNATADQMIVGGDLDTLAVSSTELAGLLTTEGANGAIDLSDAVLVADAQIASGTGVQSLAAVDDGGAAFTLTLQNATSTGAVTVGGPITVDGLATVASAYDVSLVGGGTITSDTNFLNTGALTLGDQAGDVLTFTGGLGTDTGPASLNLAGTIATTNTAMDLQAATLTADTTIVSGSGAIGAASITDGAGAFTLTLQNAVSTGTVTLDGALTVDRLVTAAGAFDVVLNAGATVTQDTNFINTGNVTLGDDVGDLSTFVGGLSTTSAANTFAAGTVATTASALDLGAATLTADASLTTAGGDLGTGAITSGGNTLRIDAGAGGDATLASFAGGGDFTVLNSGNTTVTGTLNAGTVTLTNSTGTIRFGGNTNVATDLVTTANGYSVAFGGAVNTIAGAAATTFLNTGTVSIGDGPTDATTFTQGVSTQGGPTATQIAGTISSGRAVGQDVLLGATTLIGDSTLIAGDGVVDVTSVTDGAGTFALTVQDGASTGAVSIGGFDLGAFTTAAGAYDVSLLDNGTVTGDTNFNNTGTVTLGDGGDAVDTLNFNVGLDTTANTATNIAALVQTQNTQMDLGAVTLTQDSTLRSGAGALNIASVAESGGARTLSLQDAGFTGTVTVNGDLSVATVTTAVGPYAVALLGGATVASDTTFANTGAVTLGDDAGDVTTFVGGLDTTATSLTNAAGTIATTGSAIDLNTVVLSADTTIVTDTAPITIAAVDGAGRTLDAQQAGATGAFTVTGGIDVGTLNTFAGAYDVSLLGGGTVSTATTFANTGNVTLGNDTGDALTFTGGVDTTAAAATRLAGELSTTNTAMVLGATTLTADAEIDSGAGVVNVASVAGPAQRLSLQSATSTGAVSVAGDLTVDALTTFAGNYAVSLLGGATVAQDTTFQNLGVVTLGNDAADATRFVGGLDTVNSSSTVVQGNVSTTNADIDLGATTLSGDTTVVGGAGAVDFASVTDGGNGFALSVQNATATGAVRVLGNTTLGALTTFAGAYDVALLGGGTVTSDTNFLNTAVVTLGDAAGDTTNFVGGLDTTAATTTNIAGTVRSTSTAIDLGDAVLTDTTTISSAAGTLTLADVTGATELLTLQEAGATGAVTVAGAFSLGQLVTAAGAFDTTFSQGGSVAGTTTLSNSGLNTLGDAAADSFNFTGGLTATAGSNSLFGAFSSNNAALAFGDSTIAGGTTSFTTAGGALSFGTVTGGGNAIDVDAANGAFTLDALNGAGAVNIVEAETTDVAGNFSATSLTLGGGTSFIVGGNLAVTDALVNQDIDVFTINGATSLGSFLSDAQDGQHTFVGDTTISGAFTLNNGASNLNDNGVIASTFNGAFSAASVSVAAVPIAVQFDGNVSVNGAGTFNNTSGVILGNSGDSATFGAGLTVAGPLTLFADVSAAGGAISLAGATTQAGNSSLTTAGGAITAAAIDSAGSDLALNANGGAIGLTSVAQGGTLAVSNASTVNSSGTLAAATFDLNSVGSFEALGAIDFGVFDSSGTAGSIRLAGGGSVSTTSATVFANAGGLFVEGADVSFGGALNTAGTNLTLSGAGLLTDSGAISTGAVTLTGDGRLDSTNGLSPIGGADITLGGAVNGAFAIELFAGSGNVDVQGTVNTGSLFIRSGANLTLNDVTTSGNTTRGFVTGDITLNGDILAQAGDVILVTTGGTLTQAFDGTVGSTIVADVGDVILGAKDNMRINSVQTPQGSILLTLLGPADPNVARSILRQQAFGNGVNDLITGGTGTIAITAAEPADFGDIDNGFLLDGGSLFISLNGGNSFIEASNASPTQNLDPTLRADFQTALDPQTGLSFAESLLDPIVFNSLSSVLTNPANATANRTASVSDSEAAQAQLSEEEEDLTNLSEDVFQDITLVNADQQPLCLPDSLQGFDGAPCAGGEAESVAEQDGEGASEDVAVRVAPAARGAQPASYRTGAGVAGDQQ